VPQLGVAVEEEERALWVEERARGVAELELPG
jgi:hypothetical protein